MQLLKQVDPTDWEEIPTLRQLYDDLAHHPYCTNEKGYCHIRSKSHAIKHAYIQPNRPNVCRWLVFDIDDPHALFSYYDNGLPPPQIIIKNPTNGHAHYCYKLTEPVGIGGYSSVKAMRYLASVQKALGAGLGADKGYSGNLIKNPFSNEHETYITGVQPSYTLAELAEYIDLNYEETATATAVNDSGYGRNCALFEELRHFGYQCTTKDFNALIEHLTPISEKINRRFDIPLLSNEVRHIVRSIARYCSRMDFTESHKRFSERQAYRGAKGGKAKGKAYENKREQAKELHNQGVNNTQIALKLGVARLTVIRWLKN